MSSLANELAAGLSPAGRAAYEAAEGVVFDIQRYSLHDGPGLRTDVFCKGCPLRCAWCSNPESQHAAPEPAVFAGQCIRCGQFAEPCPEGWQVHEDEHWKPAVRAEYAERARLCPAGGVRWIGERRAAGDIIAEVRRDALFYQDGGGMTLTGGEPVLQGAFAEALLRLARDECIHTALQTCGFYPWPYLARLLPYVDMVLFDVKHVDDGLHRTFTGVSNALILSNLRELAGRGVPVTVRVPLIPGFNATAEGMQAIAAHLAQLDGAIAAVDLLPYHTLARAKYAALARPYAWEGHARLREAEVEALAEPMRKLGLPVSIGG